MSIRISTLALLHKYDSIRGVSKDEFPFPFWDMVVLTASDELQKDAYEQQISLKLEQNELPKGIPYIVFADPVEAKVGCGGSTMHVLSELHARYGESLWKLRVLLINAGGQSQRLPCASVLGKIFTPHPYGSPMYQLLDWKLASYIPLIADMAPGVFHAAADTIEVYDLADPDHDPVNLVNSDHDPVNLVKSDHDPVNLVNFDHDPGNLSNLKQDPVDLDNAEHDTTPHKRDENHSGNLSFQQRGFAALAHPSSLAIGETHGVYVLEENGCGNSGNPLLSRRKCFQVLQKPTKERMREKGAVVKRKDGTEFVYTDSCFFFDHSVSKLLLEFYSKEKPLLCEIDSYGDFLQALGPRATVDYCFDTRNVSNVEPSLIETRRKLYEVLNDIPLHVLALDESKFYHLGTVAEYIDNISVDPTIAEELSFERTVFSVFQTSEESKTSVKRLKLDAFEGVAMHCHLHRDTRSSRSTVLEYCHFDFPLVVGSMSLISHTTCLRSDLDPDMQRHLVPRVELPERMFLYTAAILLNNQSLCACIGFGINDNIKAKAPLNELHRLQWFGQPLDASLKRLGLSSRDVFVGAEKASLWTAKLFPVAATSSQAFCYMLGVLRQLQGRLESAPGEEPKRPVTRVSMQEALMTHKHVQASVEYRRQLNQVINADVYI